MDAVMNTIIPQLSIITSTLDLLGIEMEIAAKPDRAFRLSKAIKNHDFSMNGFDYIIIDCPPSFNLLTINAMTAAQSVLVPLQCEFFALEGLSQLLKTVEEVKNSVNS